MRLSMRSTAIAVLLLATGAPKVWAQQATSGNIRELTTTPPMRTVGGLGQVVPLSGRGAEDTQFGRATIRFDSTFDTFDFQVRITPTGGSTITLNESLFPGGTTGDATAPVEFTITDGNPVNLSDEQNRVEIFVREGTSTQAFSTPATTFTIFVDNQPPNPPGNFTAEGADEVILVRWDAPTRDNAIEVITGYIITYSTTDFSGMTTEQVAALPNERVTTVGKLETTIGNLKNGATYFITVRSVDWVNNVSEFPKATTGGGIKVVQAVPVRTMSLAELTSEEGGCFIATAAYGSYQEPHVMVLRQFRDEVLLSSAAGKSFVRWYYEKSPKFAVWIATHDTARALTRVALLPVYAFAYLVLHPAWLLAAGLLLLTLATAGAKLRRQVQ